MQMNDDENQEAFLFGYDVLKIPVMENGKQESTEKESI